MTRYSHAVARSAAAIQAARSARTTDVHGAATIRTAPSARATDPVQPAARSPRRRRLPLALTLLLLVATVAGCGRLTDIDAVLLIEVAEVRLPCIGAQPQECLLVRTQPTQEFSLFFLEIEDFVHELGFRYVLRVQRFRVSNPPPGVPNIGYRLLEVEGQTPSPRGPLLDEAAAAEAVWHATRPVEYSMVIERLCLCDPDAIGPVVLEVTRDDGNTVTEFEFTTSAHYVNDGRQVIPGLVPIFLNAQGLFSYLRVAVANDAHDIEVEYDPDDGFPRRLRVDWFANFPSEEVEYVVHSLD